MTDTSDSGKKKPIAIRATPRQIETLQNAFTKSRVTSKDLLKRLSDETGLSTKWIVAWYSRQRRKPRNSGHSSLDPTMAPEEIANFKTEYREPMLVTSMATAPTVLSNAEVVESQAPNKKKRGRPPKSKVKVEQHDGGNASLSNRLSSPPSILLPIRPTPSVSENDICSSSFVRPAASRMYLPLSVPPNQLPVPFSNSSAQPKMPTPSNALGTLHYNYLPASSRPALLPAVHINIDEQDDLPSSVRNRTLRQDLDQDENSLFGRAAYSRRLPYPSKAAHLLSCRSAASLVKLPLFTRNVLSFSPSLAHSRIEGTSIRNMANPVAPHDQPVMFDNHPYTPFLDPSKAPLKHLTMVQPFQMQDTENPSATFDNADVMIDRLLDAKLARDDPFQATMSLVFLSQLGLEWDYA